MNEFNDFLNKIDNQSHKNRVKEVLDWISNEYPFLEKRIAWNQPNFLNQGTFILGLSHAKEHIAFAPEHVTIEKFRDLAEKNGYSVTNQIIRVKWNQAINYDFLRQMIDFNIEDKKGLKTYWRNT